MKRIWKYILSLGAFVLIATSCNGVSNNHEHKYSSSWSYDSTYHWKECEGCKEIKDKEDHDFEKEVVSDASTLEKYEKYTCKICNYSYQELIIEQEHNYETTWSYDENIHYHACIDEGFENLRKDETAHEFVSNVVFPTYEDKGYTTYTCSICSFSYKGEETDKLEHHFSSEWSFNENTHYHACIDEGYTNLKSGEEKHSFNKEVTAPTLTEAGYTTYTCSICDYSYVTDYVKPTGQETGELEKTYSFTDKKWSSNEGNWTSIKDGASYANNGVQVTSSATGASATSPIQFDEIREIVVTYCTNSRNGAGSIDLKVGSQAFGSQDVTKTGGNKARTLEFKGDGSLSGNVTITVNCSQNSIYIISIYVKYGTPVPTDPVAISLGSSFEMEIGKQKQLEVTYLPSNANQNKEVTWESSNTDVATVSSSGLLKISDDAKVGDTVTITATLVFNNTIKSSIEVTIVEEIKDAYTIMIYMCGSDLESEYASRNQGLATADIKEILAVTGQPDNVNIVIETGGASKWSSKYGISSNKLQRWHVDNCQLVKDEESNNASMGLSSTLQSFVEYGLETYPADKTGLILWNHGGALDGVCFDENFTDSYGNSDSLTDDEVATAMKNAFAKVNRTENLEWIGYDACLMAVQDIASINSQYFNYMVASQETEAGEGWDYDGGWLKNLYNNPYMDTETLLSQICTTLIADNSSEATLSVLDLKEMDNYISAFDAVANKLKSIITSSSKWTTFKNLVNKCMKFGYYDDEEYSSYNGGYVYDVFDVYDFINYMKKDATYSASMSDELDSLLTEFNKLVIFNKTTSDYKGAHGLNLFCPICGFSVTSSYTTSNTRFEVWRSLCITYGNWYR